MSDPISGDECDPLYDMVPEKPIGECPVSIILILAICGLMGALFYYGTVPLRISNQDHAQVVFDELKPGETGTFTIDRNSLGEKATMIQGTTPTNQVTCDAGSAILIDGVYKAFRYTSCTPSNIEVVVVD